MGKRLAVFAQSGNFLEGVAGGSKKFLGLRGVEGHRHLQALRLIELRVGQIHRGMGAVKGHARPRNIHGGGIGDGDGANDAGLLERLPTFADSLVVSRESGGDVRRRAGEIHDDLAAEIETGRVVVVLFWNLETIAYENERGGDLFRREFGTSGEVGVVAEAPRVRGSVLPETTNAAAESFSTIWRETNLTGW